MAHAPFLGGQHCHSLHKSGSRGSLEADNAHELKNAERTTKRVRRYQLHSLKLHDQEIEADEANEQNKTDLATPLEGRARHTNREYKRATNKASNSCTTAKLVVAKIVGRLPTNAPRRRCP